MTISDILTKEDKYIINVLIEKMNSYPTNGEIIWKSLQMYFAKLAGQIE